MKPQWSAPVEESVLIAFAFSQERAQWLRGSGWKENQLDEDYLLAFGTSEILDTSQGLEAFLSGYKPREHWFGHFDYDLKNQLEALKSNNEDRVDFPATSFFSPRYLIQKREGHFYWLQGDQQALETELKSFQPADAAGKSNVASLQPRISQTEYLAALDQVATHIQRGDIYQVNFCQEFFAEDADIDPVSLFQALFKRMPNPYSALYRCHGHYALSLSPEGFLSKTGTQLVSQPMKGTAPRSGVPEQDNAFREMLQNSEKDRRENVMITDLVRNDLSHFAAKGSVKVDELCVVKSYPKVHQMISKVRCELKSDSNAMEVLLKAFPMGSMTGAPKVRAMQIIEELESSKRGLYSGTIGYFDPAGDFDFNVVIRTLLYNSEAKYLSCHVGGGITALSQPLAEYEECMVKLGPLQSMLEQTDHRLATLPLEGV